MAEPTRYTRLTDYSDNTLADFKSDCNPEFDAIEVSIDEIVDAIGDVRRSDGALENEIVTEDSLHPDLVAKLVFEADVWDSSDFTASDIANWNTAFGWGDHASAGYLVGDTIANGGTIATKSDIPSASDIANWNTAFGWGDHASAGYLVGDTIANGGTVVEYDGGLQVDTGGLARGTDAVDLQASRSAPDEVASGSYSAILGGQNNSVSGEHSAAFGKAVTVTHSGTVVMGDNSSPPGGKPSVQSKEMRLYFANGLHINGEEVFDTGDVTSAGGIVLAYDGGVQADDSGDARGTDAVDLQAVRSSSTQVASGDRSALLAGRRNTIAGGDGAIIAGFENEVTSATASSGVLAGNNNTVSDVNSAVIAGGFNTVDASAAVIAGGSSNTITGPLAFIAGAVNCEASAIRSRAYGNAAKADRKHQEAVGAAQFGLNVGEAQVSRLPLAGSTTGGTVTLGPDAGSDDIVIPQLTTWLATVRIVVRDAGGSMATFHRQFMVHRDTTAASTTITGTDTIGTDRGSNSGSPPADWSVAINADTTNAALDIDVTATTVTGTARIVAMLELVEVTAEPGV